MKNRYLFIAVMATLCYALSPLQTAHSREENGTVISVAMRDELVSISASLILPATPAESWEVLTDYDHMADFLPNLSSCKKLEQKENTILVSQQGKASWGLFFFAYDMVTEVTLIPHSEISSHAINGSFRRLDASLQLLPEEEGTRLIYHADMQPYVNWPRSITVSMTKKFIREQLEGIKAEILKRKTAKQPTS